jgi:hypothetical protein
MPAPLVGLAVGAAARAVAKKVAGDAAKKVAKKAVPKAVKRAALVAKNKKSAKNNMKIVNKVADLQQKTKAETIAKNSVKVKPGDEILRLRKNVDSYYKTVKAKSGATAKEEAAKVASKKPAKVIKIKSK